MAALREFFKGKTGPLGWLGRLLVIVLIIALVSLLLQLFGVTERLATVLASGAAGLFVWAVAGGEDPDAHRR